MSDVSSCNLWIDLCTNEIITDHTWSFLRMGILELDWVQVSERSLMGSDVSTDGFIWDSKALKSQFITVVSLYSWGPWQGNLLSHCKFVTLKYYSHLNLTYIKDLVIWLLKSVQNECRNLYDRWSKDCCVTSWSEMPQILELKVCACWYKGPSVQCRVNQ